MRYDPSTFTYGYEIEWGDIFRDTVIPEHLGSWEYAETDICNMYPPYENIACDPLGKEPPVGGEINVKPTKTIEEMMDRIWQIKELFHPPSASCVNHGHVHIFVPGLKEDIDGLKRLIKFIKLYQHSTVDLCYDYKDHPLMKYTKTAKSYLKYDGGRLMPDYMCDNIINRANNFDEFIFQHCAGKDGVSRGRPFRYSINTYCMKHTGTIEFRCFRSSTSLIEIEDSITFAAEFLDVALNDKDIGLLFDPNRWCFPKLIFDLDNYLGWENTKWPKERGKKERKFYEVGAN